MQRRSDADGADRSGRPTPRYLRPSRRESSACRAAIWARRRLSTNRPLPRLRPRAGRARPEAASSRGALTGSKGSAIWKRASDAVSSSPAALRVWFALARLARGSTGSTGRRVTGGCNPFRDALSPRAARSAERPRDACPPARRRERASSRFRVRRGSVRCAACSYPHSTRGV